MGNKITYFTLLAGSGIGFFMGTNSKKIDIALAVNKSKTNYMNDTIHADKSPFENCTLEKLPNNTTALQCTSPILVNGLENQTNQHAEQFQMVYEKEFSTFYLLYWMMAGAIGLPMLIFFCCGIDICWDDNTIISIIKNDDDDEEPELPVVTVINPAQVQSQLLFINTASTLRKRLSKTDCPDECIPHEMKDPVHLELMNNPLMLNSGHTIDEESYNTLAEPKKCPFTSVLITWTIPNITFRKSIDDFVTQRERPKKEQSSAITNPELQAEYPRP